MTKRNSIITGVVCIVAAIICIAGWQYFSRRDFAVDLMIPSPLGENVLGKDDAPVTIIEYASTTCTHCAHFHEKTFPELKKRLIDTGMVRFIFREFPRENVDLFAYMLVRCIDRDRYFTFLGTLFKQQEKWLVQNPGPPLKDIAKQAGFTDESIEACGKNKKVQEGVVWSAEHGARLGVDSTPTFFINGKKYEGSMSIDQLEKIITPYLKS